MRRILLIFTILICCLSPLSTLSASPEVKNSSNSEPTTLSLLDALILGVVEGATEYLPVSSTGHLLIVQHLMGFGQDEESTQAANALAICIQIGAILAVLVLYSSRFVQLFRGVFHRDKVGRRLLEHLVIAFLPSAIIGLLCHDWVKENLFGVGPVAAALFVGGIVILTTAKSLVQDRAKEGKELDELTRLDCFLIGLVQCCAFWPGFSRSLATILGGLWTGLKLSAAVEFSFLLGLVTLSAATVFEGINNGSAIITHYGIISPVVALVAAFVSAVLSIKFMIRLLSSHGLTPFAYYRIVLAAICVYALS